MCLITCNALVLVSHWMKFFRATVAHFNFHPDSDSVFLLRRFLLTIVRWSFRKPWWDCDLLCWSRTSWRVQVWVPIKVAFSTIFVCVRSALVHPLCRHNTEKKNKSSSSQFSHRTKRMLIILLVYYYYYYYYYYYIYIYIFFFSRRMLF